LGQQAPCKVPTLQEADLALIVTGSQVTLVPEPIILNAPTHRQFAWMVGRMIFLPPFIKKLMHFLMEKPQFFALHKVCRLVLEHGRMIGCSR